jgi:hypothetical protein
MSGDLQSPRLDELIDVDADENREHERTACHHVG